MIIQSIKSNMIGFDFVIFSNDIDIKKENQGLFVIIITPFCRA